MSRSIGSRTLIAICAAMIVLLAVLAAVQYRWSTRVAAADAQREREHLESAAALFSSEFNGAIGKAIGFMQNDVRSAMRSGQRITGLPKIIGELYYLDVSSAGGPKAQRLTPDGSFTPAAIPSWLPMPRCSPLAIDPPPAVVAPIYEISSTESREMAGTRVFLTFRQGSGRCFIARLDQGYLRNTLIPELLRQSFGETAAREYDFAVVSRRQPGEILYGTPLRADLRKPFFSNDLVFTRMRTEPAPESPTGKRTAIFYQRMQSEVVTHAPVDTLDLGEGVWELQVAHKGVPLAAAFEQTQWRDLLLSLGVEMLLIAAIVFLVLGAAHMTRLANQKMQFVASVSHELRTPVSAISMLSRNQADGLVNGDDRVRQYGELIHQQSRRLNDMVERALQYAGIHSGLPRPMKDEVDLRRVIEEAVDARREGLARQGFQLEVALSPDLPAVAGDASLLRTAFDNLLSNAQKYADGGRWIRVRAVYSSAEEEIQVSVEDRGPGIAAADQAAIFEPFCRGQAATEAQIPGSGLGLSLVRSAAEAHRGTVTLLSEPGRGSTFTLHLPV